MNKFIRRLTHCNRFILFIPVILSLTGILGLASLPQNSGIFLSGEVLIQSAALILGLLCAFTVMNLGSRYFIRLEKFIYIGSLALLLSVYIPGIGVSFCGSRAWINAGFTTFQPSEPVKTAFIILLASYLPRSLTSPCTAPGIIKAAIYGLPFILIVAKEDFGSGCVYCAVWLFMLFCSGLELKTIGKAAAAGLVLLPMFYFFLAGYQKERISSFFRQNNLALAGTYQVWNSKIAIGSAGFAGKGYMHGTHTDLGFLPVPESDFIFSAIVEELGFIGGFFILLLFAVFIYQILKTAKYSPDIHETLICVGLAGMFFFQAFENIAMTMGVMPVTGITLPFLSYGGSALFSSMSSVGLLLDISARRRI